MKNDTPLYLSLGAIAFLILAILFGMQNISFDTSNTSSVSNTAAPNAQEAAAGNIAMNENAIAKQRANDANWSYQSDPRSFDSKPADNTATKMGWKPQDDMMVLVKPKNSNMPPFYIDAFEAFISDYRAWSMPGVYPTDKIKYTDAATACEAAGKRLCHVQEWRTACRGGITKPVQFKRTDEILRLCDFARSAGYDRQDYVEKTDSHLACTPPGLPIHHMIGNVAEFVKTSNGQIMVVGLAYYDARIRNNQIALANACERVVAGPGQYPATRFNKGTGFRCCKDAQ